MEENIDKIRKETIAEIKEKVRKNPKLLNPANKERLEYQEKLKFINGDDFIYWMQLVGIMKNPKDIDNKYNDELAKRRGLKDRKEYQRKRAMKWRHDTGRSSPITNHPYNLEKYEQYEVTDRLEKLKEICNKEKEQRGNK